MGQITQITLNDGASTPVGHIFIPVTPQYDAVPAKWVAHTANTSRLVDKDLTLRVASTGSRDKISGKITIPLKLEAQVGISQAELLRTGLVNIEVLVPKDGTDQFRKDLYAFLKNFVSSAQFKDAVEKNEAIW